MKKGKLIGIIVGVMFLICLVVTGGISLYGRQNVRGPINESASLSVEVIKSSASGTTKTQAELTKNDVAYFELTDRVYWAEYLPRISQDFSTKGEVQKVVCLRYASELGEREVLTLYFYDNGLCQVNGRTAYIFPHGDSAKVLYEKLVLIAESAAEE